MDDNFVWCALIFALAYVGRNMLPSYYEITSFRRHSLDNMRDDILALEESVEILIERVDAINDAVDKNEQELMGAIKRVEDLDETVTHNCLRLAVLEDVALSARTGKPANEARHD
jgi:hypothetical protein